MGKIVYSERLDRLVTQSCLLIRRAYRHVRNEGGGGLFGMDDCKTRLDGYFGVEL